MAKINRTDYEVLFYGRKSIVVGTFNFALVGSPRPEHYDFQGRQYDFSQVVPIPEEFECRVCSAAKYELAPKSKRAATSGETLVQRAVRVLRQNPSASTDLARHPYFNARHKKLFGFIKPGWLSLSR